MRRGVPELRAGLGSFSCSQESGTRRTHNHDQLERPMSDEPDTFNYAIRGEHASRQQALADRLVPPPDPDPDAVRDRAQALPQNGELEGDQHENDHG
jgi:hypothetical protein